MVKEIQVCTSLVVPGGLCIIADLLVLLSLVVGRMLHLTVAGEVGTQRAHLHLEDIAEALEVIATCQIALAHHGIDIGTILAEAVGQAELRQELVGGLLQGRLER